MNVRKCIYNINIGGLTVVTIFCDQVYLIGFIDKQRAAKKQFLFWLCSQFTHLIIEYKYEFLIRMVLLFIKLFITTYK